MILTISQLQDTKRHKMNKINYFFKLPSLVKEGWFVQQPIIGGLNQPPRLRPLRRLRDIFLIGAAFLYASPYRARASRPLWLRRGVLFGCGLAALCLFVANSS